MATILLFHHALGRTPGFLAFVEWLRAAGYTVHAPDLYGGQVFNDLTAGVGDAQATGFQEIIRRGAGEADRGR